MRHWKYIPFSNEERLLSRLKEWVYERPDILNAQDNWNPLDVDTLLTEVPELKVGLDAYDVYPTYAVAIHKGYRSNPRDGEAEGVAPLIHVDNMPGVMARLLFPVLNCETSRTVFYKCSSGGALQPYDGGRKSHQYESKDCVQVDQVQLTRPIILRVDKPHAVHVDYERLPRISLSLRLNKDPMRWMF